MSKYLNLFFNKINAAKKDTETDPLDKLLADISKDLCTIDFIFEDILQNENPFSMQIKFNYTTEFIDLLLSSGLVLNLSYEHIYKKLNQKRECLQQSHYDKQKESDDLLRTLVSIFKAPETSLDNEFLEIITQLDEAMHFLGRIQNKKFLF